MQRSNRWKEANKLGKEVEKSEKEFKGLLLTFLPKKFRTPIAIKAYLVTFWIVIALIPFGIQATWNIITETKCENGIICGEFNLKDWSSSDAASGFIVHDKKPLIISPKQSSLFEGDYLYMNTDEDLNYTFQFTSKPFTTTTPIVYKHGPIRCIIQNGNNRAFGCEQDLNFGSGHKEKWQLLASLIPPEHLRPGETAYHRYIAGEAGIKPSSVIQTTINSRLIHNTSSLEMIISLVIEPSAEDEKTKEEYRYIVQDPSFNTNFSDAIGVGLIDPFEKGDVKAEFIEYSLNSNPLLSIKNNPTISLRETTK